MADFTIAETIENRILDILTADTSLDRVQMFIRGLALGRSIPTQYYPYVEVLITGWTPGKMMTGGLIERTYAGVIRVSTQVVDEPPTPDANRRAVIPSYAEVQRLANNILGILSRSANQKLGGLLSTDTPQWAVQMFLLDNGQYGIDAERVTTLENFTEQPFSCRVQEAYTP